MRGRRVAALALAVLAVAALLVAVGRWERQRRADEENAGMAKVLAAIGPLDSPGLSAFRVLTGFQCLLYTRNGNRVALELCADAQGRVVETFDRRGEDPRISSLRDDPSRAEHRVDRAEVDRLLLRMGVPRRILDFIHARAAS